MSNQTNSIFRKTPRAVKIFLIIVFFLNSLAVMTQSGKAIGTPWDGEEVFNAKGCNNCHSVNGVGGRGGPDLRKDVYYGTYLELASLMWNHYPKMSRKMNKSGSEYPTLTENEMSLLITYLTFQRYLGEPGSEFTGRKLLEEKECFSCHRFGGKGADIGPDISKNNSYLSPLSLAECMWNHGPDMMGIFEKHHIKRPQFSGNDIAHLATGIRSYMPPANSVPVGQYDLGDPENGEKLLSKKGCLHCHSVKGKGGDLAVDFAESNINYSVTQIAGEMWNHGPEMWDYMKTEKVDIPRFEAGEMADIISYLYFLNFEDTPGDPAIGFEILESKKCFTCHTIQNEIEKTPLLKVEDQIQKSPVSMIAAMWNHAPAMEKKIKELPWRERISWPKLSTEDMTHLYAYFKSLPPPESDGP